MKFIDCLDGFYGAKIHVPVLKIDAVVEDTETKKGCKVWVNGRVLPCALSSQDVMKLISSEVRR